MLPIAVEQERVRVASIIRPSQSITNSGALSTVVWAMNNRHPREP
jgi:hypothetical protein